MIMRNEAAMAIHNDLVMRGQARWTSLTTSQTRLAMRIVSSPLIAQLRCFSMDTDPRDAQAAMIAIYRYVALPSSGKRLWQLDISDITQS